jgi:uncharacterized lipoprotein YbaY
VLLLRRLITGSLLVTALVACGDSGAGPAAPATTPPALATLDVGVTVEGDAAPRERLTLRPGDARLQEAQDAIGLPLPPSIDVARAEVGAAVYDVTAVLSDGTAAAWRFDDADVPDELDGLVAWLETAP